MDQLAKLQEQVAKLRTATGKTHEAVTNVVTPQHEQARARTLEDDIREQEERAIELGYELDQPCVNPHCDGIAYNDGPDVDHGFCIPCRRERTKQRAHQQALELNDKLHLQSKDNRPEFPDYKDVVAGALGTDVEMGSDYDNGQETWDIEQAIIDLKDRFNRRSLSRRGIE